jgi:hypothetical protein
VLTAIRAGPFGSRSGRCAYLTRSIIAQQGDVALLADAVAQELLSSREMAHLAYVWPDSTPRVVSVGVLLAKVGASRST